MGARRINPNFFKLNRSYTRGEIAKRANVHKNTVRNWMRNGLEAIAGKRPLLFAGSIIRAFLQQRNAKQRCRCEPGEFYCFGCRTARTPAAGSLECHSLGPKSGMLRATCQSCGTAMYRRVTLAEANAVARRLPANFAQPQQRLEESGSPPSNCDSERRRAA